MRFRRIHSSWLIGVALLVLAGSAQAQQERVAILGLQSPSGDDGLAREFTALLRMHSKSIADWEQRDVNVSLEQMMLVQGCTTPDYLCLDRIAEGLKVDALIYGAISVEGVSKSKKTLRVALYTYKAGKARLQSYVVDRIKDGRSKSGWLSRAALLFVQRLSGTSTQLGNEPGA